MFNPEQLLGQMMTGALGDLFGGKSKKRKRGWGMSTATKATVGLGLLGVAMAAWEHMNKDQNPGANTNTHSAPPPPPANNQTQAGPPPPPAAILTSSVSNTEGLASSSAPISASNSNVTSTRELEAKLLIRAMIAAAAADGAIDPDEHEAILARARNSGLNADGVEYLQQEMIKPLSARALANETPSKFAAQVYTSALLAISADSESEAKFLDQLAVGLNLDIGLRAQLHAQFDAPDACTV